MITPWVICATVGTVLFIVGIVALMMLEEWYAERSSAAIRQASRHRIAKEEMLREEMENRAQAWVVGNYDGYRLPVDMAYFPDGIVSPEELDTRSIYSPYYTGAYYEWEIN